MKQNNEGNALPLIFSFALILISMDAIDHHQGEAPLGDLWHLLKYCLFGLIILTYYLDWPLVGLTFTRKIIYVAITIFYAVLCKVSLWWAIYEQEQIWRFLIKIDNSNFIQIPWRWLEKFLGFHN